MFRLKTTHFATFKQFVYYIGNECTVYAKNVFSLLNFLKSRKKIDSQKKTFSPKMQILHIVLMDYL